MQTCRLIFCITMWRCRHCGLPPQRSGANPLKNSANRTEIYISNLHFKLCVFMNRAHPFRRIPVRVGVRVRSEFLLDSVDGLMRRGWLSCQQNTRRLYRIVVNYVPEWNAGSSPLTTQWMAKSRLSLFVVLLMHFWSSLFNTFGFSPRRGWQPLMRSYPRKQSAPLIKIKG